MNWFNFECLWRNEEKPLQDCKEKKSQIENNKVEYIEHLICSRCFIFVDKLEDYGKRAQIGKNKFGFCSLECYNLWLKSPHTMLIGKLN